VEKNPHSIFKILKNNIPNTVVILPDKYYLPILVSIPPRVWTFG